MTGRKRSRVPQVKGLAGPKAEKSVNLALSSPVWLCRSTGKRPVIHS